jgi:hypothetical protein
MKLLPLTACIVVTDDSTVHLQQIAPRTLDLDGVRITSKIGFTMGAAS